MNVEFVRAVITQEGLELLLKISSVPFAGELTIRRLVANEELEKNGRVQFTVQSIRPFDNLMIKGTELVIADSQEIRPVLVEILQAKKGLVLKIKLQNLPVIGEMIYEEVIEYDKLNQMNGFRITLKSLNPIIEDNVLKGIALVIEEPETRLEEAIPAKPGNKSRKKRFESKGYKLLGTIPSSKRGTMTEVWYHKGRKSFALYSENANSENLNMSLKEEYFDKITEAIKDQSLLPISSSRELAKKLEPTMKVSESTVHVWKMVAIYKKMIEVKLEKKGVIIEKFIE